MGCQSGTWSSNLVIVAQKMWERCTGSCAAPETLGCIRVACCACKEERCTQHCAAMVAASNDGVDSNLVNAVAGPQSKAGQGGAGQGQAQQVIAGRGQGGAGQGRAGGVQQTGAGPDRQGPDRQRKNDLQMQGIGTVQLCDRNNTRAQTHNAAQRLDSSV